MLGKTLLTIGLFCGLSFAHANEVPAAQHFREHVRPILEEYCFDCHADGANKGGVAFDDFKSDDAMLSSNTLWLAVLKNLRSGIMPPQKKARPNAEQQKQIEDWIKYDAFDIDPNNPDPGRVTVRKLNRAEYRNTIRDLMGVDYNTDEEFPPDDSGYGFDDIGDVLTLSPMLMEKYIDAAKHIVSQAVPTTSRVMPEHVLSGQRWRYGGTGNGPVYLSYYEKIAFTNKYQVDHAGHYQLVLNMNSNEKFVDGVFDYNKCRIIFKADGEELLNKEYIREGGKQFHYEFERDWQAGPHEFTFELQPTTPDEKQVRSLNMRVDSVAVRGPSEETYWVEPKNYRKFFAKEPPEGKSQRRAYAHELLAAFATKAFRRPADNATVNRLTDLAENLYTQPGKSFEEGVSHAMVGVLASPQFLFRMEDVEPHRQPGGYSYVDEYSLASRLSYFLWSSMPDDELIKLAAAGNLRKNLPAQVKRMLADPRSGAMVRNFTGQWLQNRDIFNVAIDARAVLSRDEKPDPERDRFRELASNQDDLTRDEKVEFKKLRDRFFGTFRPARVDFGDELRRAMATETELYFSNVVHEDRSITELIESDYTFLNGRLARHYGLTNLDVTGADFRKVALPPGCPRGGVLTMGTVLAVTSNPTRTSPVKRGLFVLDNILGNPTPPPPPNIPPLEDSEKQMADHVPTLREVLAVHRDKPMCASCHGRMDPIGLSFENFNAMGMWREREHDVQIDPSGTLITGESFKDVRELKHILATKHRDDFYRTLTEKMLTYALGRGLEYYDTETVDKIVERLRENDGHFSAMLNGIIESSPFQMRRSLDTVAETAPAGTGHAVLK